jgi:hypothetical protein
LLSDSNQLCSFCPVKYSIQILCFNQLSILKTILFDYCSIIARLLFYHCSIFWSWKCIPMKRKRNYIITISTSTKLDNFRLSIGFLKAYCHRRH